MENPEFWKALVTTYGPLALGWPVALWAIKRLIELQRESIRAIERNTSSIDLLTQALNK